jgi:hypothetical protein
MAVRDMLVGGLALCLWDRYRIWMHGECLGTRNWKQIFQKSSLFHHSNYFESGLQSTS